MNGVFYEAEIDGLFRHAGGCADRNIAGEDLSWTGRLVLEDPG